MRQLPTARSWLGLCFVLLGCAASEPARDAGDAARDASSGLDARPDLAPDGSPDGGARDASTDGATDAARVPDAGSLDASPADAGVDAGAADAAGPSSVVPARGSDTTLDIACWNLEWFGSTGNGPKDEAMQLANAQLVIGGTDLDVWGLAEIVSAASFGELLTGLPGYAGILSNASTVTSGSAFYEAGEQKLALVYKTRVATLVSASLILTGANTAFAGRPPLEARFTVKDGATTKPLTVIVLHAKASDDMASWTKRADAAAALKTYLDSQHATDDVIVMGDFNDLISGSITSDQGSPYASLLADPDYTFVTQSLVSMNVGTTVGRTTTIDHHLVTDELSGRYVSGSVQAYRVDAFITGYADTTSDHYPVLSRYRF